jgi:hypothetical protein
MISIPSTISEIEITDARRIADNFKIEKIIY